MTEDTDDTGGPDDGSDDRNCVLHVEMFQFSGSPTSQYPKMAASYTFLPIKSQIYFGKSCKTRVADFSPLDKSATCLNIYLEIVTKIGITFPPAKCTVFG